MANRHFPVRPDRRILEASIGQKVDARRETEVSHKLIAA
jgi:hypothetical protein